LEAAHVAGDGSEPNWFLTPGTGGHEGCDCQGGTTGEGKPQIFWIPQQFEKPSNPEFHKQTTAEEIWDDTNGKVDILVAAVGTGRHDHGLLRSHQAA